MAVGDLGHLDPAGRLHVDGRADDMIVSGGENVHPGEVEDLLAAHPAIDEAAVGVPDEEFGHRLRAYVVARGLTEDDVKQHIAANLARHKVPRDVIFLDALPATPPARSSSAICLPSDRQADVPCGLADLHVGGPPQSDQEAPPFAGPVGDGHRPGPRDVARLGREQ